MENKRMHIDELKRIARENGIVGAGGAGFPAYAKMTDKADTVILNCVECEPLLKLHRQLLTAHTEEIIQMLDEVRAILGAGEAIVGIKSEYKTAIEAVEGLLPEYSKVRICPLKASYPMGDEIVLIYEATGRVIAPGGLPIDENVIVFNTETMYNLYRAVHEQKPVSDKLVSIVGEVASPVTVRLPLGISVADALELAGGVTTPQPAIIMGGPMMGTPGTLQTVITKTTNGIIVLPENHELAAKIQKNFDVERRRAASSCCQCRTCTDMCSRHVLGHPIEPHKIMRAIANQDVSDLSVYTNAAYCSGCGICEKYACPQSLSPKSVIQEFKVGLKKAGIRIEKKEPAPMTESGIEERELRKVPVHRLAARLGLTPYDKPAPMQDTVIEAARVRILMSQHIGAPARPIVSVGDSVRKEQRIAEAAEGLGVAIHASVTGTVEKADNKEIVIRQGSGR